MTSGADLTEPSADGRTCSALLDPEGVVTAANEAWKRFCGPHTQGPTGGHVGASYLAICDAAGDDVSRAVGAVVRQALAGRLIAPLPLVVPCVLADRAVSVDLWVTSRFDDGGRCLGAMVALRERVPAPDDLTAMVDAAPGGLLAVDSVTGAMVFANRRVESRTGRRVESLLVLHRPDGSSGPELSLLEETAPQLALADELGRVRVDQERLLLLEERDRVARDLHDTVLQDLIASGMHLEKELVQTTDPAARSALVAAVAALEVSVRRFRGAVFRLRRDSPRASLTVTVDQVVAGAARALTQVPEVVVVGRADRIPAAVAQQIEPVLREALSNVIRHSGCGWCRVRLSVRAASLTVTVEDDGVGPGGPGHSAPGDGLRNLDRRARVLGGRSSLQRRSPRGARLVWRVPIPGGGQER